MDAATVLDAVTEALERWGWVPDTDESEDGLDLVAAFEAVAGVPLRDTTPEVDLVVAAFADAALDEALRLVASIVGADPDDGPLPEERWAWVHTLTTFNDAPDTDARAVTRVLAMAADVARTRGSLTS